MIIAIFAKRCQTKEGKTFYRYLSTLTTKTGEEWPVQVKFREDCGAPKPDVCPVNIEVTKENCNLATREYTVEETGEVRKARTLWVTAWNKGPEYVDHSLDDIM